MNVSTNPLVRMLAALLVAAASIRLAWELIHPVLIPLGILALIVGLGLWLRERW